MRSSSSTGRRLNARGAAPKTNATVKIPAGFGRDCDDRPQGRDEPGPHEHGVAQARRHGRLEAQAEEAEEAEEAVTAPGSLEGGRGIPSFRSNEARCGRRSPVGQVDRRRGFDENAGLLALCCALVLPAAGAAANTHRAGARMCSADRVRSRPTTRQIRRRRRQVVRRRSSRREPHEKRWTVAWSRRPAAIDELPFSFARRRWRSRPASGSSSRCTR